MTDELITVPRAQFEDMARRLVKLEAAVAQLTGESSQESDPLRDSFHRFNARAREREARRAG